MGVMGRGWVMGVGSDSCLCLTHTAQNLSQRSDRPHGRRTTPSVRPRSQHTAPLPPMTQPVVRTASMFISPNSISFHTGTWATTLSHTRQSNRLHKHALAIWHLRDHSHTCQADIYAAAAGSYSSAHTRGGSYILFFFSFFCPLPRFEVQCSLLKQIWINRKQANTCRDKLQDISDGQKLKENEWMDQHPWCLKSKGYVSNVRVWRDLTLVQRTTQLEQLRNEENEPWSGTCSYIFTFFSSYPELKIQGEDMSSTIISWVS